LSTPVHVDPQDLIPAYTNPNRAEVDANYALCFRNSSIFLVTLGNQSGLLEKQRRGSASYPVPVITMSKLKVVMPLMLDDALNVNVAVAT
jgi:hypothetical protein